MPSLAAVTAGALIGACDGRVPLGSWVSRSSGGGDAGALASGGAAGTNAGSGGALSTPGVGGNTIGDAGAAGEGAEGGRLCGPEGTPGPLNAPGVDAAPDVTLTYRDYTWPSPVDSIEWELRVESTPPADGYLWVHDFRFTGGGGGLIGIQKNGLYQAYQGGSSETADMVVFWISPDPLDAELGDVPFPLARTLPTFDVTRWMTIHAKYAWQACKSYFLRVGQQAVAPSGAIWYGAWIREGASGTETFLGRILVPRAWGQLDTESASFSNRIGWGARKECGNHEYASAYFGLPTANGGTVRPSAVEDRFGDALRCPTSRITKLPDGVRHELGLPMP